MILKLKTPMDNKTNIGMLQTVFGAERGESRVYLSRISKSTSVMHNIMCSVLKVVC